VNTMSSEEPKPPIEIREVKVEPSPTSSPESGPPTEKEETQFCDTCGSAITAMPKYCHKCGARIIKICRRCGRELLPQARFCDKCGTRVRKKPRKKTHPPQITSPEEKPVKPEVEETVVEQENTASSRPI